MYPYNIFFVWWAALTAIAFFLCWLWNKKLGKEVERKTAALAQSVAELRRAKEEWERTFDAVPDLITILDGHYRILKMNRATSETLNLDATCLSNLKCHDIFHGSSVPPTDCPHTKLLVDGREHAKEVYVERLGMHVLASVSPLTDAAGRLIGSVHVARDITARKLVEKRIKRLSAMRAKLIGVATLTQKMTLIAECMNDLFAGAVFRVWMVDKSRNGADANPLAWTNEPTRPITIGNTCLRLIACSGKPSALEQTEDWHFEESRFLETLVARTAGPGEDGDESQEGYTADCIYTGYRILSDSGVPIGAFLFTSKDPLLFEENILLKSIVQDVTHILRDAIAEDALKGSEKCFRRLFESLIDVYVRIDPTGKIEMVSPSVESVTGFLPEEIQHTGLAEYGVHPNQIEELMREIHDHETLHNREVLLKKKDGKSFWASFNAKQLKDARNDYAGAEVMFRDVTENKLTEELMRIQRDLSVALIHAHSFDQALDICLDAAMKIKEASGGGIYLNNNETGRLDLMVHRDLPPEFVDTISHLDKESPQSKLVAKGQSIFQSYEKMRNSLGLTSTDINIRNLFGLRAVAVVPMSHEGKIIGCLNVASITSDTFSAFSKSTLEAIAGQMAAALVKIKTDQALQVSQHNLKTLFESLDDFLFILDELGGIIEINPVVERRLGFTVEELTTMHVAQIHPPERRQEAMDIVQQMLDGQIEFCPIPLMARNGEIIPVETKVTPGTWNGRPALFGISRDIHLRLEAEEARRISEARLMAAIDAIDEGFVIYDKNDRLVMCNNKYLDIYKESADLIKPGARFEDIIREGAYRGQYADAWGDVERWISERMTLHQRCNHNLEQHLNDGRWLRIVERRMDDGSTVGFRVDITDMKRTEDLLRKALQERETLLREVHHRVKNNLAVISSMLNLQVKSNNSDGVRQSLQESRARVQSMALIHETLHQTDDLSILKLKDYVSKLIRDLSSVYEHFSDQFEIRYELDDVDLDLNQAVYCGLIINELVTNSLKYAFTGEKRGTIHISARRMGDEEIRLSVKDDGIGLPPTFDWRKANTLGLRLIALMVEQLHGSLELNSDNGLETVIQWKSRLIQTAQAMAS